MMPVDVLTPGDEMRVSVVPELILTLGMLGVADIIERSKHEWAGDLSCPELERFEPTLSDEVCDVRAINPIDRWVASQHVEGAAPASDVLLGVMMAAPFGVAVGDMGVDRSAPAGERLAKDALVIAETYALTQLATSTLKVMVHRLRPYNYNPLLFPSRALGDSRVSFPSGHTSMAFTSAATLAVLLDQRYPGSPWAVAGTITGFVAATTVGTLRVLAGRHFLTDVLVGAALGTAIGLIVPIAHRGEGARSDAQGLTEGTMAPTLIQLGGRF